MTLAHRLRAAGGSKGGIIEQNLEFWIDPADTNSYSTSSPSTVTSLVNSYVAGTNGDTDSFVSTMYGGAAPTNVTENGYNTWTSPANWWEWNQWSAANNKRTFFGFIENSGNKNDRLGDFGTQNFSVEIWIKPTQDKIPIEAGFKQGSSYTKLWQLYLWSNSGPQYSWWMYNQQNTQSGFYNSVGDANNNIGWGNNSNWYHFVVSLDIANNNIKIYINNSLNKNETNTNFNGVRSVTNNHTTYLSIGGAQSEQREFEGSMGPVRLYLGKALTAAEVNQHWEHEKARFGY